MVRRRRRNRKWLIGGVILVLLIAVGVGAAVLWNNEHQGDEQESETGVVEEEAVDAEKHEEETEEEYSERMAEQKKVKQYEGEDPNKAEELTGAVTYAGVNNGTLIIGVNIDQYLNSGKCDLSLLRNGGVIYSESVDIIADVTTSSCDEINTPVVGLGNGNTEIVIKLSANGKTGTIRGEVDI